MWMLLWLACTPPAQKEGNFSSSSSSELVQVDVLLVVDNSESMSDENSIFAGTELLDALEGTDWQIGITTTTVAYEDGLSEEIDPGESGTLVEPGVIRFSDPDPGYSYRQAMLCGATCWNANQLPSDSGYDCIGNGGTIPSGGISKEYLDCICGISVWEGHCGGGNEEGLEATLLSMCLASENPPDLCFNYEDPISGTNEPTPITVETPTTSLMRGPLNVLILSDEGDSSRRIASGDAEPSVYENAFDAFATLPIVSMIGPPYHDGKLLCNGGGAIPWGIERYQNIITSTGGDYWDIEGEDTNGDCSLLDLSLWMTFFGDQIRGI